MIDLGKVTQCVLDSKKTLLESLVTSAFSALSVWSVSTLEAVKSIINQMGLAKFNQY